LWQQQGILLVLSRIRSVCISIQVSMFCLLLIFSCVCACEREEVRERVSACMCEWKKERERERERDRESVCVWERSLFILLQPPHWGVGGSRRHVIPKLSCEQNRERENGHSYTHALTRTHETFKRNARNLVAFERTNACIIRWLNWRSLSSYSLTNTTHFISLSHSHIHTRTLFLSHTRTYSWHYTHRLHFCLRYISHWVTTTIISPFLYLCLKGVLTQILFA